MQKNKRVLILGGGISGLSLAYFLKDKANVILLEKKSSLGGWMESDKIDGLFFERGPRTFKPSKSVDLLALINDLGLEKEIIFSDPGAKKRYIMRSEKLHQVGGLSKDVIFFLFALLREWKVPRESQDETIYDFVSRRLSKRIADDLFDPLVVGMFGGDIRKLSITSCFPQLKNYEVTHGSIVKGFLKREKKEKHPTGLFTLKNGMGHLVEELSSTCKADIHYDEEAVRLEKKEDRILVHTNKESYFPDCVISAMPHNQLAKLFYPLDPFVHEILQSIPSLDINLLQIGYKKKVLAKAGFGYLVPSHEKEAIMGVVFDSEAFPQQNGKENETRLTMMCRHADKDEEAWKMYAKQMLRKHLNIHDNPDVLTRRILEKALPQYVIGHKEKIFSLEKIISSNYRNFYLTGNYLEGVSVNDCIKRSKKIAAVIQTL